MSNVLYDNPGPRARRRAVISSAVVGVLFAALLVMVLMRLGARGQLEGDKWSSLFNPGNPDFVPVWKLIGRGLRATLIAASLSMAFSLILGAVLAVLRLSLGRAARLPVIGFIELFRGLPVVITLYLTYRVLPEVGLNTSPLWYAVIGLTAYNSVIIAEIVRAGVVSLPRGQAEAAKALGLTKLQSLRFIELPQAVRVMLPSLISQLVVVLKDTSLIAFVGGYIELLRQGNILVQNLRNPIQTYLVVALIYIAVNYALSRLAVYAERRLSQGPQAEAGTGAQASAATTGA